MIYWEWWRMYESPKEEIIKENENYNMRKQSGTPPQMLTRRNRMVSAFGWWLAHSDGYPNRITGHVICGVAWKGITH